MRDRLIELLRQIEFDYSEECVCAFEDGYKGTPDFAKFFVDHLLENGVIVPPCKVGDTVYYLDDIVWDDECRDCEHYLIGGFGDPSECGRTRYGSKHPDCIKIKEEIVTQRDIYYYLYAEKFGKTVFLTKEEAEKALAEVANDA